MPTSTPSSAPPWVTGQWETSAGSVPQVATRLQSADWLGTIRARVGLGRMRYAIAPGLYAVGEPSADAPVFVSANYKLSFDCLRRALEGRDGWILVLDTKGINVWCAAGKGTFGTDEIVHRIEATKLPQVVDHRTLILPQLSAPGVSAHQVKQRSSFRVIYGPVRARDLPAFLDAGMRATPEMRRVSFSLGDRLVLVPIELVNVPKSFLLGPLALWFLAGLGRHGYSFENALNRGLTAALLCVLGFLGGAAVTPILLPWLPGRAFSTKGAVVGLAMALAYLVFQWPGSAAPAFIIDVVAWFLILPAVSAFFAMTFTGASTYTSLSGVEQEVRVAMPAQIVAAILGVIVWLVGRFV